MYAEISDGFINLLVKSKINEEKLLAEFSLIKR